MIMSKEIQEYSSRGYVTPFALFKIKRDDSKHENDMEYILDLQKSYFKLEDLEGKDLVFADPMNATGGSFVTVVKYILDQGVKPRSVSFFNVIISAQGALRIARAIENCNIYTLWMDPVLNESAYILPASAMPRQAQRQRREDHPRNNHAAGGRLRLQYSQPYRSQLERIEDTVLGS
jgi:uracil phosphoribosyltransferase